MKAKTREAVSLLRFIASLLLFIGITIAIGLVLAGLFLLASEDESFSVMILKASAPSMIIGGIIIALWHTLLYALLNGFAVIVENSDRSQVERALYAIANSVRNSQPYEVPYYQENNCESNDTFPQEDISIQDTPHESSDTNEE